MTQLYLISAPKFELNIFRKALESALTACEQGFVGAFQLRLKDTDDADIIRATKELLPICREHGVAFIMNDRADLCAELMCDGVHVGQEDLEKQSIKKIQQIIGDEAVIGVTCHASTHLAMEAAEAGADYVAFGAFYETTSKPKEKLEKWGMPAPDILQTWSTFTTIPCVAIGGITPQNAKLLIEAGADFLAVITAVWSNPAGPAEAVKQFKQLAG